MRWIDSRSESWSKLARIFIHMNLGWQSLYITHLPLYYNGTALFSPSSDHIFKILSVTVEPAARCLKVPKSVRKFCSLYLHWILKRTWLIQSRTTTKVSNTVVGNTWIILNLPNSIIQEYLQLVSVNKITGLLSPLSSMNASVAEDTNEPSCNYLFRFARQQGGRFNYTTNSEAYRMTRRKLHQKIHKTKPLLKCYFYVIFQFRKLEIL